ncbi:hypothetical protein OBV_34290 [Oscillibacter valericigenes Sjm18-20]|nr:hypothetical protein OBV_34290 [Oscillibacter valericigenes Sjm18-20]
MIGEYPILTAAELMVLLGVSGGKTLYGFWQKSTDRREILCAAGQLTTRGLLTLDENGFQISDEKLPRLLAPLREPRQVVLLTPLAQDQPQVCYVFGDGAVGYEFLLVQPGAVRLFPMEAGDWIKELRQRGIVQELDEHLPDGYRRDSEVEADFQLPVQALAVQWRHATALLEYQVPNGQMPEKKVILLDGPEEARAVIVTEKRSWLTNDALDAIRLIAEDD